MSVPVVPIVTVLVVILLSMLITRFATIALTLTGLSRQAAQFQARSALTGTGFTTSESEAVVDHPVRRRIIRTLMLFGSAGIVTVLASVMLTFTRTASTGGGSTTLSLLLLVAGIGVLLLLMRLGPVDRAVSRLIRFVLRRYTDLDVRDYAALLEIQGGYAVTELRVAPQQWVADRTLAELRLMDEGVIVLGVQRPDGSYLGAPGPQTVPRPGDVLVLYGHSDRVAELDLRERGEAGERRHQAASLGREPDRDLGDDQARGAGADGGT